MLRTPPLFALGFRVFFLGAALQGALVMLLWAAMLNGNVSLPVAGLPTTTWHAHEMLYGFAHAAIAGFLLTAVRNWTKQSTVEGWPLGGLAAAWAGARALVTFGDERVLIVAGLLDVGFALGLLFGIGRPILAARQTRQAGIVAKVALLVVGQLLFYAGALDILEDGERLGIGIGVYIVLALVITVAGRVLVFFVKSTFPDADIHASSPALDRAALLAFFGLAVLDVFTTWQWGVAGLAACLAILHTRRLVGWWTPQVLGRSLLWVLYLGLAWVIVGFVLLALGPLLMVPRVLAIHAFLAGGIGVMVAGMMTRVTLGHTGRDVRENRRLLSVVFLMVTTAATLRVFGPWFGPAYTPTVWVLAAVLWGISFAIIAGWMAPMLTTGRPDGRPG